MGWSNLSVDAKSSLSEIARMAWGSGRGEGVAGGRGNMGILLDEGGRPRVIKFDTHFWQRQTGDQVQKENAGVELRRTLLKLAQSAGLDSETMQTVERELGVQRQSGEEVAIPRSLLTRKIVARVVTAIGGDQVWQSTKDGRQMQAYRSQGRASDFATVSAAAAGASEARTVAVVHDELSAQKFNELATAVAGRMRQAVLGAGGNENRAAELRAHFDGVLNGCLENAAADYRGLVESCSLQHVSEDDVERFLMATASRILLSETDIATTKAFLGTEAFANSRVGLELDVLRQCRQFGPACYPDDPTRLLRDYVAAMNRTGVPKDAGRVQQEVGHWRLDFGDDASRAPDVRAEVRGPLSSVRCLADLLGAKAKPDGSGPFIRRLLADAVGTEGTMIGWASTLDAAGDLGGEAFTVLNARMKEAHETLMEFERLTGREIGQAFQTENPNLAARATFDRMIASQQALADHFESAAGEVRDGSAMRMRASSIRQRICEISRLAGELTQRVREEQQGQVHDVGLDRAWTTSQLPTISGDSPEIAQALMTADEDIEFAFTELERIGEIDGPLSNERLGEVAHCLRSVGERLETFKGRVRDGAALAALQGNLRRAADLFEKKNEAVGRRLAEQMLDGIPCPPNFEEENVPEKIQANIPKLREFHGLMRNYRQAAKDYISTGDDLSRQRMDEYYAKLVEFNPGTTLGAAIRSATRDGLVNWDEIKKLGLHAPMTFFNEISFAQNLAFVHRRFTTAGERMAEGIDFQLTGSDVLSVLSGDTTVEQLVEARLCGYGADDLDAELAGCKLTGHWHLNGGLMNVVTVCTFEGPGKTVVRVFKPEPGNCDVLIEGAFGMLGTYSPGQFVTDYNLASVAVARELGCEDLLPKTSFGVLDGKYGMFMEFATGHAGKAYVQNSEKEPAQRVNLLPFDSQQMEDGENLKLVGDMARQMNRLQWLDILTGQLDRHVSNFMVDVSPSGKVQVKGFDNDASFPEKYVGVGKFRADADELKSMLGKDIRNHPAVTEDPSGHVLDVQKLSFDELCRFRHTFLAWGMNVPPVMDADLYERLSALAQDGGVKLGNILRARRMTDAQVQAAVSRLEDILKMVADDRVLLLNEKQGDWSKLENIARIQRNGRLPGLVADYEKDKLLHPGKSHYYDEKDVGFAKKMMTSNFVNCGFAEYLNESNRAKLNDLLAAGE